MSESPCEKCQEEYKQLCSSHAAVQEGCARWCRWFFYRQGQRENQSGREELAKETREWMARFRMANLIPQYDEWLKSKGVI